MTRTVSSADILGARILIVDDQPANILLLQEMLSAEGYLSVTSTMDPTEVCTLHLLNRYDLILLDLQMPVMDGFQVMENLKGIEGADYLPVLVVTAQPGHKVRALREGARDFVSKPFDLAEVLIRVHNMLEVRLLHLQTKSLYERILAEQEVSNRLILEMLPRSVAERVMAHAGGSAGSTPGLVAESYAEVAVHFSSIVEFTAFCEGANAEVLTAVLDEISTNVDSLRDDPDLERETIVGDAYVAAYGLPGAVVDQTARATSMALDLRRALDGFNKRSRFQLKVRIGLDATPTLALAGAKRKVRKAS